MSELALLIKALDKLGEDISVKMGAKLDAKLDKVASRDRQEEIQTTVNLIGGYVKDHGEVLAGHKQWIESHGEAHTARDRDFRALSNRVWILSGGSGLLATVAMILQRLNI